MVLQEDINKYCLRFSATANRRIREMIIDTPAKRETYIRSWKNLCQRTISLVEVGHPFLANMIINVLEMQSVFANSKATIIAADPERVGLLGGALGKLRLVWLEKI